MFTLLLKSPNTKYGSIGFALACNWVHISALFGAPGPPPVPHQFVLTSANYIFFHDKHGDKKMFHILPRPPPSLNTFPKGILRRQLGLALGKMWDMSILKSIFIVKTHRDPPGGSPGGPGEVPGAAPGTSPGGASPDISIKGQRVHCRPRKQTQYSRSRAHNTL